MPEFITCVPSLQLLNRGNKCLTGSQILQYIPGYSQAVKAAGKNLLKNYESEVGTDNFNLKNNIKNYQEKSENYLNFPRFLLIILKNI